MSFLSHIDRLLQKIFWIFLIQIFLPFVTPRLHMSVRKKCLPNRSSCLTGYWEHINECLVVLSSCLTGYWEHINECLVVLSSCCKYFRLFLKPHPLRVTLLMCEQILKGLLKENFKRTSIYRVECPSLNMNKLDILFFYVKNVLFLFWLLCKSLVVITRFVLFC